MTLHGITWLGFCFLTLFRTSCSSSLQTWVATHSDLGGQTAYAPFVPQSRSNSKYCILLPRSDSGYYPALLHGVATEISRIGATYDVFFSRTEASQRSAFAACVAQNVSAILALPIASTTFTHSVLTARARGIHVLDVVHGMPSHAVSARVHSAPRLLALETARLVIRHSSGTPSTIGLFLGSPQQERFATFASTFIGTVNASASPVNVVSVTHFPAVGVANHTAALLGLLALHPDVTYIIGPPSLVEAALVLPSAAHAVLVSTGVSEPLLQAIPTGRLLAAVTDSPVLLGRVTVNTAEALLSGLPVWRRVSSIPLVVNATTLQSFDRSLALPGTPEHPLPPAAGAVTDRSSIGGWDSVAALSLVLLAMMGFVAVSYFLKVRRLSAQVAHLQGTGGGGTVEQKQSIFGPGKPLEDEPTRSNPGTLYGNLSELGGGGPLRGGGNGTVHTAVATLKQLRNLLLSDGGAHGRNKAAIDLVDQVLKLVTNSKDAFRDSLHKQLRESTAGMDASTRQWLSQMMAGGGGGDATSTVPLSPPLRKVGNTAAIGDSDAGAGGSTHRSDGGNSGNGGGGGYGEKVGGRAAGLSAANLSAFDAAQGTPSSAPTAAPVRSSSAQSSSKSVTRRGGGGGRHARMPSSAFSDVSASGGGAGDSDQGATLPFAGPGALVLGAGVSTLPSPAIAQRQQQGKSSPSRAAAIAEEPSSSGGGGGDDGAGEEVKSSGGGSDSYRGRLQDSLGLPGSTRSSEQSRPTSGRSVASSNVVPLQDWGPVCQRLQIDSWDVSAFDVEAATGNRALSATIPVLVSRHHISETLTVDAASLRSFLADIEAGYDSSNPYHTATHAMDVTQAMHHFLCFTRLERELSGTDKFSLLIAAACHDYRHPGINNKFLVATSHEMALVYNDASVLENMHVSEAFRTMRLPGNDILALLPDNKVKYVRNLIIRLILATDLASSYSYIAKFKSRVEAGEAFDSAEDRLLLMQFALKCGDVGHPARPLSVHLRWSDLISEEFFRQGDREKALGLPVSPLCDRDDYDQAKSQQGFINFVVKPLFRPFTEYMGVGPWSRCLDANLAYWEAQARKQKEEPQDLQPQPQQRRRAREMSHQPVTSSTITTGMSATVGSNCRVLPPVRQTSLSRNGRRRSVSTALPHNHNKELLATVRAPLTPNNSSRATAAAGNSRGRVAVGELASPIRLGDRRANSESPNARRRQATAGHPAADSASVPISSPHSPAAPLPALRTGPRTTFDLSPSAVASTNSPFQSTPRVPAVPAGASSPA